MSRIRTPDNIEIASLKKKQQTIFDPMTSGVGTPWEDRGTHGTVSAFIKTCIASMFRPAKLMGQIRRPEATSDARGFLFGICAICGISALIHQLIAIWHASQPDDASVLEPNAGVWCALALGGASVGMFFLYRFYNLMYRQLIAAEKDAVRLPAVLVYNINVYALGPTVLALIPYIGPPIALLWIFINLIVAGSSRLRLRTSAAIIDALLTLIAMVAIAFAAYFVVEFLLLHKLLQYEPIEILAPAVNFGPAAP